jgi:hypothetical protein
MELKQFITDALLSITQGVEEANGQGNGRFRLISDIDLGAGHCALGVPVEFDVAIEVVEQKEKSAGAKLGVAAVGIGGDIKNAQDSRQQHRLKFKVFVNEK